MLAEIAYWAVEFILIGVIGLCGVQLIDLDPDRDEFYITAHQVLILSSFVLMMMYVSVHEQFGLLGTLGMCAICIPCWLISLQRYIHMLKVS